MVLVGNVTPRWISRCRWWSPGEITVTGSCASQGEYAPCLDLIVRNKVNVDSLISARAPLSEGAAWFERLYRGEPGLMKVILQP